MKYSKEFKIECVKKYKASMHIDVPLGVTVDTEDKLITLDTCDIRDNSKRIVILSKMK